MTNAITKPYVQQCVSFPILFWFWYHNFHWTQKNPLLSHCKVTRKRNRVMRVQQCLSMSNPLKTRNPPSKDDNSCEMKNILLSNTEQSWFYSSIHLTTFMQHWRVCPCIWDMDKHVGSSIMVYIWEEGNYSSMLWIYEEWAKSVFGRTPHPTNLSKTLSNP